MCGRSFKCGSNLTRVHPPAQGPRCSIRTQRQYSDAATDYTRLSLLYVPGVALGSAIVYALDKALGLEMVAAVDFPEPFNVIAVWGVALPCVALLTNRITDLGIQDFTILKVRARSCWPLRELGLRVLFHCTSRANLAVFRARKDLWAIPAALCANDASPSSLLQAPCPECGTDNVAFFGSILSVKVWRGSIPSHRRDMHSVSARNSDRLASRGRGPDVCLLARYSPRWHNLCVSFHIVCTRAAAHRRAGRG